MILVFGEEGGNKNKYLAWTKMVVMFFYDPKTDFEGSGAEPEGGERRASQVGFFFGKSQEPEPEILLKKLWSCRDLNQKPWSRSDQNSSLRISGLLEQAPANFVDTPPPPLIRHGSIDCNSLVTINNMK